MHFETATFINYSNLNGLYFCENCHKLPDLVKFSCCLPALFIHFHSVRYKVGNIKSLLKNIPHTLTVITTRMLTSIIFTINLTWHECCIILSPLHHKSPSIPPFPSLKCPSLSLLAVSHGWALSTGVLWQKPAQQEYFSWRCHNLCTLWEPCQGLFSIIRSITNSHRRALHPLPPPHTHQVL